MNQKELLEEINNIFKEALEIVRVKNSDYAKEDGDAFHNFRFAKLVGIEEKRGILIRITDKLARISNLLDKKAEVKDESIDDTLKDLINYSAILLTWLRYDRQNKR